MIVNCPKCNFEQPIDEYCAQCGAPLRKLIALEKAKKQNSNNLPIYVLTFSFFIVAGLFLYLNLKGDQNPQIADTNTDTEVVVNLKPTKIKAKKKPNTKTSRVSISSKSSAPSFDTTDFKTLENKAPEPETASLEEEPVNELPTSLPTFSKLSVVSLTRDDCSAPSSNTLNEEELSSFRNCITTISTRSFSDSGEILAQGESFETIVNWNFENGSLQINVSFASEDVESSQSESATFDLSNATKGLVMRNPFTGLIEKEVLKDDAATNILNATLFEFESKEGEVFFLLSE